MHIPPPTTAISVSPIPNNLDQPRWLALDVDPSYTDRTGTSDVELAMKPSNDNESREILNIERGQTILDALEHSEIRSQTEVKHKFLMLVMIPGLCVLAMYVLRREDSAQYKIIAVATCIFCNAFLAYWGYLVGTASQLHCIRLTTTLLWKHGISD